MRFNILLLLIYSSWLFAQSEEVHTVTEEVVVWGRSSLQLGAANSASEGFIGYSDISERPLLRVGELTEVVPGMIATQHSGSGKANQYFLRGMNLDHGSDFSVFLDGLPVNFRTHAHAQGYLDLNIIIPEVIESIGFRKGPYHSEVGDFSLAGTSAFTTYDQLERNFIEIQLGSFNERRLVTGLNHQAFKSNLLFALELQNKDGPWELPENLDKLNLFLKSSTQLATGDLKNSLFVYSSSWNGTDQIPQRWVDQGNSRFSFIDQDIGGQSQRFAWISNFTTQTSTLRAFLSSYELNLFSNPTYFLNDPIVGDEIEQEDARSQFGLFGERIFHYDINDRHADIILGMDYRYDEIDAVNLFGTNNRDRHSNFSSAQATVKSLSIYIDNEIYLTEQLRARGGFRGEFFNNDVLTPILSNSGQVSDALLSPKFSLSYLLNDSIEIYLNAGKGFHSNDARGTTLSIDSITGEQMERQNVFARGMGREIGFRYERGSQFNMAINLFELELDSELIFVGDAGTTEPTDGSKRQGIEFIAFWEPRIGLAFDISGAKTSGRYTNVPITESFIPDAHELTLAAGVTQLFGNGGSASLRLRHFGDAPLTTNNEVRKSGTTIVNFGLEYPVSEDDGIKFEILNLLDSQENDITYFFESKLLNEGSGIEDFHFHPVESRSARVSYLKYF